MKAKGLVQERRVNVKRQIELYAPLARALQETRRELDLQVAWIANDEIAPEIERTMRREGFRGYSIDRGATEVKGYDGQEKIPDNFAVDFRLKYRNGSMKPLSAPARRLPEITGRLRPELRDLAGRYNLSEIRFSASLVNA